MKTVLVGINAKFIHSNLGIHSIRKYAEKQGLAIDVLEYTINQSIDDILERVVETRAEVIGFSCYIWNIEMIKKIVIEIQKIMPETMIILGGPEVSYEIKDLMLELPMVDMVIYGEGEKTTYEILSSIENNCDYKQVAGIAYRVNNMNSGSSDEDSNEEGTEIIINPLATHMDMDDMPFIYEDDMSDYDNRILYYESTRGCPFNCQYCLSSIEKGIRYRSLSLVQEELQFFLDQQVKQVKFVDRTFNCNHSRTHAIWSYIIEHDNGFTNFHFEIAADLLTDGILELLESARPGLIQLEIGVQSTNPRTLEIVQRVTDFSSLTKSVNQIQSYKNIHIHLDLIAGLPAEGYERFSKSFDDVYSLQPDQLQLGFLKVLKGSGIKHLAKEYGLVYRDYAPYEILKTNDLTFAEMSKLKMVEYVLELYYNSGHFRNTLRYLEGFFDSPFQLYEGLGRHFADNEGHLLKHSKLSLYGFLKDFGESAKGINQDYLIQSLKYDLMLQEKIKKYPEWLIDDHSYDNLIRGFFSNEAEKPRILTHLTGYTSKQLSRLCHVAIFDYDMIGNNDNLNKVVVIYDYVNRNKLNNEASTMTISLEELTAIGSMTLYS